MRSGSIQLNDPFIHNLQARKGGPTFVDSFASPQLPPTARRSLPSGTVMIFTFCVHCFMDARVASDSEIKWPKPGGPRACRFQSASELAAYPFLLARVPTIPYARRHEAVQFIDLFADITEAGVPPCALDFPAPPSLRTQSALGSTRPAPGINQLTHPASSGYFFRLRRQANSKLSEPSWVKIPGRAPVHLK